MRLPVSSSPSSLVFHDRAGMQKRGAVKKTGALNAMPSKFTQRVPDPKCLPPPGNDPRWNRIGEKFKGGTPMWQPTMLAEVNRRFKLRSPPSCSKQAERKVESSRGAEPKQINEVVPEIWTGWIINPSDSWSCVQDYCQKSLPQTIAAPKWAVRITATAAIQTSPRRIQL